LRKNDTDLWENFFNWSLSFKLESDFNGYHSRNSHILWKENKDFNENQDFTKGKKSLAFALISNCAYNEGRLDYLHSLEKYIPVDLFGRCGKPCPFDKEKKSSDCVTNLFKDYKFYFSFENSFCKNYVVIFCIKVFRNKLSNNNLI
jgi:alpha-1,3-fucosyltransferase